MTKSKTYTNYKVALTIHSYPHLCSEHGMLDLPAVHALMEYALTAGKLIEDRNTTVTGQPKKDYPWRNIMLGISKVHGVPPEEMIQHWDEVDRVLAELKLKPITSIGVGNNSDVRMAGKLLTSTGKVALQLNKQGMN